MCSSIYAICLIHKVCKNWQINGFKDTQQFSTNFNEYHKKGYPGAMEEMTWNLGCRQTSTWHREE
uniref:Uncharacterized protein n=1 Tax=Anguilla anguilla TaxID=7936 RepID=A0A0E9WWX5_ANGAN